MLLGLSAAKVEVRVDPGRLRPSDVPAQVGDPSRLRQATGWEPRIPLEQSLADLLEDWRVRVAGAADAHAVKVLVTGGDRLPRPLRGAPARRARALAAPAHAARDEPGRAAAGQRGGDRRRDRRRVVRARGRGLRRRAPPGGAREALGARPRALPRHERGRASRTLSRRHGPPARGSSTRRPSSRSALRGPARTTRRGRTRDRRSATRTSARRRSPMPRRAPPPSAAATS